MTINLEKTRSWYRVELTASLSQFSQCFWWMSFFFSVPVVTIKSWQVTVSRSPPTAAGRTVCPVHALRLLTQLGPDRVPTRQPIVRLVQAEGTRTLSIKDNPSNRCVRSPSWLNIREKNVGLRSSVALLIFSVHFFYLTLVLWNIVHPRVHTIC